MNIFKPAETILIKVDDFREEKVEDFITNNILKHFNDLKNADDIRKAVNAEIINVVCAYAASEGLPALSDDIKNQINEKAIIVEKDLNVKLQNQLRKKSKAYIKRHSDTAEEAQ